MALPLSISRRRLNGALYDLHGDRLDFTVLTTDSSGSVGRPMHNQSYTAYGKYRLGSTLPTEVDETSNACRTNDLRVPSGWGTFLALRTSAPPISHRCTTTQ